MSREFIIHKRDGAFQNTKAWREFWEQADDGRYLVRVQAHNKRSIPQNAWFHAVLPEILYALRDAGFDDIRTEDDAKELIKWLFFRKSVTNGSETFEIVERTSEQSKINFADKADEIIRWASEYLGIDIAPPEKQLEMRIDRQT